MKQVFPIDSDHGSSWKDGCRWYNQGLGRAGESWLWVVNGNPLWRFWILVSRLDIDWWVSLIANNTILGCSSCISSTGINQFAIRGHTAAVGLLDITFGVSWSTFLWFSAIDSNFWVIILWFWNISSWWTWSWWWWFDIFIANEAISWITEV